MKITQSLMSFVLLLSCGSSFAQGTGHTGGSLCEILINDIRNDLKSWIIKGGSNRLNLSSLPMEVKTYNRKMMKALNDPTTIVSCSEKSSLGETGVAEYPRMEPIFVDGKQKTCDNWLDKKTGIQHIRCDYSQFYYGRPQDQYKLIHHEFASLEGVGIEKRMGAESDYTISNQVQKSLRRMSVFQLSTGSAFSLKVRVSKGMDRTSRSALKYIDSALKIDLNQLSKYTGNLSVRTLADYQRIQMILKQSAPRITSIEVKEGARSSTWIWLEEMRLYDVLDRNTGKLLFSLNINDLQGRYGRGPFVVEAIFP